MTVSCGLSYEEFLTEKVSFHRTFGFRIDDREVNPALTPHQKAIVHWAVRGGRRAVFAAFGLGKSVMQLEIVRLMLTRRVEGTGLIVCPLGVRQEFVRDATALLGLATPRFVRRSSEVETPGIYLTNYESIRDEKLDSGETMEESTDGEPDD